MGWSVKAAFGAALVSLAVMTPVSDALAATPTDRLERFWQNAYSSRARVAADEAQIPLMAKAQADECYGGIGTAYMDKTAANCPQGRVPKVNQAYVWGLTKTGSDLWFGTAPNVVCLVFSTYLHVTTPIANDSWSCQFGQSPFTSTPYLAAASPEAKTALGDWRPSKLYRYRQSTGALEDLTAGMPPAAMAILNRTLGIRSAGSLGNSVLFAGPTLSGSGLNVFLFDAATGAFVKAATLPQYDNIRRFVVADGHLYTAVGKVGKTTGGALLRWAGDTTFVNVGNLPAEGADLAEHQGRIYVTTWPQEGQMAGLYMSPKLVAGGLPDAAGASLAEVWTVDDYEPDAATAATYGGGALASYDGRLIWGTMHVPFTAALNHFEVTGDTPSPANAVAAVAGTWRAVAIFSGDKLDRPAADRDIDLLYGSAKLPAWDDAAKVWRLVPNVMDAIPQLGQSGFDDPFNNYTWAMGQTKSGLYVGTMDWSYVFSKALPLVVKMISGESVPASVLQMPSKTYGADLMKITSVFKPAVAVSRTGVGNFTNYGVRTMVAEPDTLYLGTANPMNMLTVPDDDVPEGGWELRRIGPGDPLVPAKPQPAVTPSTPQATPTGSAPSTSAKCVARNRRFHLHLGLRMKAATAKGARNVRAATAKVNGKAVTVRRTSLGLVVPVDLRGVTARSAKVEVVLRLKKPTKVQRRDGASARTTRIARTYVFTTCS